MIFSHVIMSTLCFKVVAIFFLTAIVVVVVVVVVVVSIRVSNRGLATNYPVPKNESMSETCGQFAGSLWEARSLISFGSGLVLAAWPISRVTHR